MEVAADGIWVGRQEEKLLGILQSCSDFSLQKLFFFSLFIEVKYFLREMKRLYYRDVSTAYCSLGEHSSSWRRNFDVLLVKSFNSK